MADLTFTPVDEKGTPIASAGPLSFTPTDEPTQPGPLSRTGSSLLDLLRMLAPPTKSAPLFIGSGGRPVMAPQPTLPPLGATLPLTLGGVGGLKGALGRIGASGVGGAVEGGPEGALTEGARTALIESLLPGLGKILRGVPWVKGTLPTTSTVRTPASTIKDYSHAPWVAGQGAPATPRSGLGLYPSGQGAQPQFNPQPATITERTLSPEITTGGRPYLPNLPPQLRALLEYATGSLGLSGPRQ